MSRATIAARPADPAIWAELNAYNASFHDLGLRWHWDVDTFLDLQAHTDPCERLRRYLEASHPHLLKAYDAEFLASAIEARKSGFQRAAAGTPAANSASFDWAESRAGELGA